jgi:maltodextrin utilization protein YvdJ
MARWKDQFSFAEMTSNSSGKTSASASMGVLVCCVGCLAFLTGVFSMVFFHSTVEILVQSILMVYAGAALLGYNKMKDSEVEKQSTDQ